MFQRPVSRRQFVTGMLVVGTGAAFRGGSMAGKESLPGLVDSGRFGGESRYLTFVSTDKPIYRGGENLYVRGVVLHHASHAPLNEPGIRSFVEVVGPKGDQVASGFAVVEDGVLGFAWRVPDGQAGGEYVVRVTFPGYGHTAAERKFDVRAYRAPRLKTQIKFLRDGYGPGDEVAAPLRKSSSSAVDLTRAISAKTSTNVASSLIASRS
jgi:uncharacterized protein YfaS (alpha-2-macroglobulin family)